MVNVGTGIMKGRVHAVSLLMQNIYFPATLTVFESGKNSKRTEQQNDSKDVKFILELYMLIRLGYSIDLEHGKQEFLEVPFLHEEDLDVDKGVSYGFDAEASNDELMQHIPLEPDEDEDDDDATNRNKDSNVMHVSYTLTLYEFLNLHVNYCLNIKNGRSVALIFIIIIRLRISEAALYNQYCDDSMLPSTVSGYLTSKVRTDDFHH